MKYEKTGPFKSTDDLDQWITQAMTEAEDTEAEEFLSPDADDVEISEDLDRRILGLIEKPSSKEIFLENPTPCSIVMRYKGTVKFRLMLKLSV